MSHSGRDWCVISHAPPHAQERHLKSDIFNKRLEFEFKKCQVVGEEVGDFSSGVSPRLLTLSQGLSCGFKLMGSIPVETKFLVFEPWSSRAQPEANFACTRHCNWRVIVVWCG